jgi:hypothetical protein
VILVSRSLDPMKGAGGRTSSKEASDLRLSSRLRSSLLSCSCRSSDVTPALTPVTCGDSETARSAGTFLPAHPHAPSHRTKLECALDGPCNGKGAGRLPGVAGPWKEQLRLRASGPLPTVQDYRAAGGRGQGGTALPLLSVASESSGSCARNTPPHSGTSARMTSSIRPGRRSSAASAPSTHGIRLDRFATHDSTALERSCSTTAAELPSVSRSGLGRSGTGLPAATSAPGLGPPLWPNATFGASVTLGVQRSATHLEEQRVACGREPRCQRAVTNDGLMLHLHSRCRCGRAQS